VSVKSSTIMPTKIGSTGNIKPGNTSASNGMQWDHLPSAENVPNANVQRRSVSNAVPASAQKNSPGDAAGRGSGEHSKPAGRQIDFLPKITSKP